VYALRFANGRQGLPLPSSLPMQAQNWTLKKTGKKRVRFSAEVQCYAVSCCLPKIDLTVIK
jgi:hypothetical protein